jgi:predicted metal-dependent hydrolase|tara:strand:+ start:1820 stop:2713 length:894 start_codon:yes stop_codon:yes gene_type:complete
LNRDYQYQAKQVQAITIRPFSFDFPDDLDPKWVPSNIVRSHFFNGVSLTMPYLEPFLVKTMREAAGHLSQPELLEDIRAFNGQEASHYKCHRRLNTLLKTNGYPEFEAVEARLDTAYKKLSTRSLRTKLAYSAGFECMTNGFTTWLINKRQQLFAGASPHIASFWLMHMIEETEHKTVAFDVYMAYSGQYWPRAIGVFHGSFHVLHYGIIGMFTALKKDGTLGELQCLTKIIRHFFSLLWNVAPFLLRALLPWYNPRREADPEWMRQWVAGHAKLSADDRLPLVDTSDPEMPVPFIQ